MKEKNELYEIGFSKMFSKPAEFWAWEIGLDEKYAYISKHVEKILGYEQKEMIGKNPVDFLMNSDSERFKEQLKFAKNTQKAFWNIKFTFNSRDNQQIEMRINGKPKFDDHEKFCGYYGVTFIDDSPSEEANNDQIIIRKTESNEKGVK